MIRQERRPGPAPFEWGQSFSGSSHVLLDRFLAHLEPQLQQFPLNPLGTPGSVVDSIASIRAIVSAEIRGLHCLTRDFRRQNNLKPNRCHPISVSGFTTIRASRQLLIRLANTTNTCRSRWVIYGRLTCRSSTINLWRKNMFPRSTRACSVLDPRGFPSLVCLSLAWSSA